MNRRESILFNDPLRHQDRIFEVVTIPGHERDTHVLPKSKLTQINRRSIRENIATLDRVSRTDNRALIDTSVLVGTLVLRQVIDINRRCVLIHFSRVNSNNNATGVHRINDSTAGRHFTDTRITSDVALHSGADQGRLSL